ncbi:hypothetical protein PENSPDRAFT_683750 [Peniophora sp. CONT]|nr:hypothetical protein PENSPDRAFT_683750 [Peniophora sp. CONT]
MNDFIRAAREHNTLTLIHRRLSNENICDIFLALAQLDIPSSSNPAGWFSQANGVCHLWREMAVHCPELWARSAGSFPSRRMTDLAILRAKTVPLSFDGHYEDDEDGPGYVLTDYQLSLLETHVTRLRSLVHETYTDWSERFYCLKAFPKLKKAGIWDDSGPNMWHDAIDAPSLRSLYVNNALIPFIAPTLRYLRIDMDNIHWRSGRDPFGSYEPVAEGCETVPRVFPTGEFIAFLQRSPLLERLIVTDMPLLLSKNLPAVSELRAELPKLRGLHLGGKSEAMGDLWQRLAIPGDAQVYIDTDFTVTRTYNSSDRFYYEMSGYFQNGIVQGSTSTYQHLHESLLKAVHDQMNSSAYDSLRLGMTPSYDLVLQMWSSDAHNASGLELTSSLDPTEPTLGPAFTLRLPIGTHELLTTFMDRDTTPPSQSWRLWFEDPFQRLQNDMAKHFCFCIGRLTSGFSSSLLEYIDLTDVPHVEHEFAMSGYGPSRNIMPDETIQNLFRLPWGGSPPRRTVILNWTLINRFFTSKVTTGITRLNTYLPNSVNELTVVDFPCASFPDQRRYDEGYNDKVWSTLLEVLEKYSRPGSERMFALKLAESTSEMSNMERSEALEYEHTITGSYEDAVRAVTERGYQRIVPFVTSFEDLRIHTWP